MPVAALLAGIETKSRAYSGALLVEYRPDWPRRENQYPRAFVATEHEPRCLDNLLKYRDLAFVQLEVDNLPRLVVLSG